MKHAGIAALDTIDDLLEKVRKHAAVLTERKRGTFYLKSSAFLHFHEDPAGMFADLKLAGEFQRFRVSTRAEQAVVPARARYGASAASCAESRYSSRRVIRPPETVHTRHAGSASTFPPGAVPRITCCCTKPLGVACRRTSS